MRPGWAKPCECGQAERGAYCPECRGFGDGFSGGTYERTKLDTSRVERLIEKHAETLAALAPHDGPVETYCPGGHRGATVRGNAAYCAECGGRLKPTHSSSSAGVGTGH